MLAPFRLTNALLNLLSKSDDASLVNLTSTEYRRGSIELGDLEFRNRRYSGSAAYSQSKLGLILLSAETARRLVDAPVRVNAIHPGPNENRYRSES